MGEGQPSITLSPCRPVGIWILTLFTFVVAFLFVVGTAPWFLFPPHHAQLPPGLFAWLFLLIVFLLIGTAYGTWAGSRYGRNLFLLCTAIVAACVVFAQIAELVAILRLYGKESWITPQGISSAVRTTAVYSAFWFFWVAFTSWYLLRSRTRVFYQQRSDSRPWFAAKGMAIAALGVLVLIFGSIEAAYQTLGPERNPPPMLATQLEASPGAELTEEDQFGKFPFLRDSSYANPWETEESEKFTARLRERFPIGTMETKLIGALTEEGFHAPPIEGKECTPSGEIPSPEKPFSTCNYDGDPAKTLEYAWWRFAGWRRDKCTEAVHVHWSTGAQDTISDVKGEYIKVCGFLLEPRHWLW